MPTNKEGKKVVVNGAEEPPIRKFTLPVAVDWQTVARQKHAAQKEKERARAEEAERGA